MIHSKLGQLSTGTATGSLAVTGVGFQPQVILFWGSQLTANDDSSSDIQWGFGAAVDKSDGSQLKQHCVKTSGTGGANPDPSKFKTIVETTRCFGLITGSNTENGLLLLSSMDTDGFTLNRTQAFGQNSLVNYLALAGLDDFDLTNVAVSSGTGTQAVTGLGFQPDAGIFFSGVNANLTTTILQFAIGLASGSAADAQAALTVRHTTGTTAPVSAAKTGRIFMLADDTTEQVVTDVSLSSFDADGFTINRTTNTAYAAGNAPPLFVVTLKAPEQSYFLLRSGTSLTSTGNINFSDFGFKPSTMFMVASAFPASGVPTCDQTAEISVGAATSAANQQLLWFIDTYGLSPVSLTLWQSGTALAFPSDSGEIVLSSFNNDGLVLEETFATATENLFFFLAIGDLPMQQTQTQMGSGPSYSSPRRRSMV